MQIPRDAVLLRIFFGEDDKFRHLPLHKAIVLKAREMRVGGATVLRGQVGFGHSSRIHTTKILRLSQDASAGPAGSFSLARGFGGDDRLAFQSTDGLGQQTPMVGGRLYAGRR